MKKVLVEPKGLGDLVANITYFTGIDSAVKKITKAVGFSDCGCSKRREQLNELFPFKKEE